MQIIEILGKQGVAYIKYQDVIDLMTEDEVDLMTSTSVLSFYIESDTTNFKLEGETSSDVSDTLNLTWGILTASNHEYIQISYKHSANSPTEIEEGTLLFDFSDNTTAAKELAIFRVYPHTINYSRTIPEGTDPYPLASGVLHDDKTSFGLIRTNPKLTGNVKLTVDSSNGIWLNSISANKELDNSKFKKYTLSKNSNYAIDLRKFLNDGIFPTESLYHTYQESSDYQATKNAYNQQYDTFYGYGVQALRSEFYDEDFSFFAPLWIRETLPEYFVIMRVDTPYNPSTYEVGKEISFREEVLMNAKIIKTFDLSEKSNIGRYIRNTIEDPNYKSNPLDVYHQEDVFTSWNGIAYDKGFLTSRSQYLSEYFQEDHPIIDFEDFMTKGFERHKLVCVNMLNLEFLFSDEDVDTYTINRYVGFYVNAHELATYNLDIPAVKELPYQTPEPSVSAGLELTSSKDFTQENTRGIVLPVLNSSLVGTIPTETIVHQTPRVFYVQDKQDNLHTLYSVTSEGPVLKETEINLTKFTGTDDLLFQSRVTSLNKGSSGLVFTLGTSTSGIFFEQGDYLQVEVVGLATSSKWRIIASSVIDAGEAYYASEYDDVEKCYITYFSGLGGEEKVLQSISLAFNTFATSNFKTVVIGKEIIFFNKGTSTLRFRWNIDNTNYVKFNGISMTGETGTQTFVGGLRNRNASRVKATKDSVVNLNGTEYFVTNKGYSQIKEFTVGSTTLYSLPYIDEPIYDGNTITGFKDYDVYKVIEVVDDEAIVLNTFKQATAFNIVNIKLGILSFFPVKDFDFDFHSTDYTKSHLEELRRYFVFDPGVELPMFQRYKEIHGYELNFFGRKVGETKWTYLGVKTEFTTNPMQYTTDPDLIYEAFKYEYANTEGDNRVINISVTEDVLGKFKGFFAIHDFISKEEENLFTQLLDEEDPDRFVLNLIDTEYDRLRENENKNFVLTSRIVPNICKWVLKGGKDVRNNPYRLNNSGSFGLFNFSPSHTIQQPTPEAFTHEWFYLDGVPSDYSVDAIANTNSYFFEKFDKDLLASVDEDYFTKYFTVGYPTDKYFNESILLPKEERFSFVSYNALINESEVFFKGIRFKVKGDVSERLHDYKFSVILKHEIYPIDEVYAPVEYELVENKKWKTLTLVITARFNDYKISNSELDYTTLYNLVHNQYIDFRTGDSGRLVYDHIMLSDVPDLRTVSVEDGTDNKNVTMANINFNYNTNFVEEMFPIITNPLPEATLDYYKYVEGGYSKIRINGIHRVQTGRVVSLAKEAVEVTLDLAADSDSDSTDDIFFFAITPTLPQPYTQYDSFENMTQKHVTGSYAHYISGGYGGYKSLMNRLSFAYFKANELPVLNISVTEASGEIGHPDFTLEVVAPDSIAMSTELIPEIDSDKPQNLLIYSSIGYTIDEENNRHNIYRYNGKFEPKFKDVIYFQVREDDTMTTHFEKDFLLLNTKFFVDHPEFGIVKNFYYNKIADSEILRLAQDNAYESLYPMVDEISIARRDLNIFSSTWDKDYYRLYTDVSQYSGVDGYNELLEKKNFFGSKVMTTPKTLSLETFSSTSKDTNIVADIIYSTTNGITTFEISLDNRIVNHLIADGATLEFDNLVTTIGTGDSEELTNLYLKNNILNLYDVTSITIWENQVDNLSFVNTDLTESEKIELGYKKVPSIKVTKTGTFKYKVEKVLDTRKSYSFAFSVTVEKV